MVLCLAEEITSLLTKWLQSLESLAAYLTDSSHCPSHSIQASTTTVQDDTSAHQRHPTFEEISKAFQGETYLNLSAVVKTTVTELATMCAEMEVYAFESVERSEADQRGNGETTSETRNDSSDMRYTCVLYSLNQQI